MERTVKNWNKRLVWLAVVWGIILVAFCLMGCSTKLVTEFVEVHDTLRTVQTDTVRDVRVVVRVDTLRQLETHHITVNERGDTIREVHHYHEVEKTVVVDSTDRYQSKVDSLQSVIDRLQEKEVTKVPWWSDWGWKLGVALVMCGLIIYTLVRLHNGRL